MYIIKTSGQEGRLIFTVSNYSPGGHIRPIKDCNSEEEAWRFIHFLNGGSTYDEHGSPTIPTIQFDV